jgi:hypothetical protein
MIDKTHCMVNFDQDFDELVRFYHYACSESKMVDPVVRNNAFGDELSSPTASLTLTEPEEHELRLASGRTLGHRSNARDYRQNLRNYPSPAEKPGAYTITDSALEAGESGPSTQNNRAIASRGESDLIGVSDTQK